MHPWIKRSLALHESAHAITARSLGFQNVYIETTGDRSAKAYFATPIPDSIDVFCRVLVTYCAGDIAEKNFLPTDIVWALKGKPRYEDGVDGQIADRLVNHLCPRNPHVAIGEAEENAMQIIRKNLGPYFEIVKTFETDGRVARSHPAFARVVRCEPILPTIQKLWDDVPFTPSIDPAPQTPPQREG